MDQMKSNLQYKINKYFEELQHIQLYTINNKLDFRNFLNKGCFTNNSQVEFLPQHNYIKNIENAYKLNEYELSSVEANILSNVKETARCSTNLKLEFI